MNHLQHKQYASAFRLTNHIVIHSDAKTQSGIGIATAPYFTLDVNASMKEIGNAIQHALAESKTSVAHTDYQEGVKPLLKAAGLRSYRRFVQGAIHCSIVKDGQSIWIDPTHNGGTRGDSKGFHYKPDLRIVINSQASEELLGNALFQGFEACSSVFQENQ